MSAEQGSRLFPNSGEPVLRDLKGGLWRVEEDCWIDTGIVDRPFCIPALPAPGEEVDPLHWIAERLATGRLIVRKGYIFDGSSIPLFGRALDESTSFWPPLVHDVDHEAMRAEALPQSEFPIAAALYARMERAFGALWLMSKLCHAGLLLFGHASASPKSGAEYPVRHATVHGKAAA